MRDGRLLWSADLETGDLSSFLDRPGDAIAGHPPALVTSPTRTGHYALAVTVPGASTTGPPGSRNEIVPRFRDIVPDDDLWFGLSTYLDAGFPVGTHWQSVLQLTQRSAAGSPPVGLYVEDGQYRIEGGAGNSAGAAPFNRPLGPATTGTWTDWVFHVVFSPNPQKAVVDVWRDGVPALPGFEPPAGTMYPQADGAERVVLELGYDRRPDIAPPGTVVFDDLRIGTTMGAVRHLDQNS